MATLAHAPATLLKPARFSSAEFFQWVQAGAFAGSRVELDEGELVKMSPPNFVHTLVQDRLLTLLKASVGDDALALAEVGVDLGRDTARAIDVAIVVKGVHDRAGPLAARDIRLAVEVANTTLSYDLGAKLASYALAGIPEYWVVDIDARVTNVMRDPEDSRYRERSVVRFAERLIVPGTGQSMTIGEV